MKFSVCRIFRPSLRRPPTRFPVTASFYNCSRLWSSPGLGLGNEVNNPLSISAEKQLEAMEVDYKSIDWKQWDAGRSALQKAVPHFAELFARDVRHTLCDFQHMSPIVDDYLLPHLRNLSVYHFESGGKLNRGSALINASAHLCADSNRNAQRCLETLALASAIELMQDCFLLVDDIMDSSVLRRGRPCYYRTLDSGIAAVNDGLIMEQIPYWIAAQFIPHGTANGLSDLLRQVFTHTTLGQSIDVANDRLTLSDASKLKRIFALDRYWTIVALKTAHYSARLPLCGALFVSGMTPESHRRAFEFVSEIGLKIGAVFQMDDDWLDVFGDIKAIGKDGTDIAEAKCTWLTCATVERANDEQLQTIAKYLGQKDTESVARIKRLMCELDISAECKKESARRFTEIEQMVASIEDMPELAGVLNKDMFADFLVKLKNRGK